MIRTLGGPPASGSHSEVRRPHTRPPARSTSARKRSCRSLAVTTSEDRVQARWRLESQAFLLRVRNTALWNQPTQHSLSPEVMASLSQSLALSWQGQQLKKQQGHTGREVTGWLHRWGSGAGAGRLCLGQCWQAPLLVGAAGPARGDTESELFANFANTVRLPWWFPENLSPSPSHQPAKATSSSHATQVTFLGSSLRTS